MSRSTAKLCTMTKHSRLFEIESIAKLEHFGDTEMDAQRYDEAIAQYSAALSLDPDSPRDLFIKRSKARMAKELWDDALNDANEAITRDPSSPWGYEIKHTVLHGAKRYADAVDAFEMMLSKMAECPDPEICKRRSQYISPSNTRVVIHKIVQRTIRRLPHMLINTSTGRLQSRAGQASAFESAPVFNKLLSSMTTRIDRAHIKREVKQYFRYVMLSQKWEKSEPLFQRVIHTAVFDLDTSPVHDKLQTFCKIVRDAGFNWAWSDDCCIDKQNHVVLQEALVAMFKWYCNSAMVIVYLRGVRSPAKFGDLVMSIWNTRAWAFQEYVAAKVIRFYTEDWNLYRDLQTPNHKESPEIISEMEQATGVSAEKLMALRPGLNSIREKLCLASTRQATLVEDAAYSLFGIFSVTGIPRIYGEGENAMGRLLAHILSRSGDVRILAWTGKSSSINSCLPAHVTVYSQPMTSHLPLRIADTDMEITVAELRHSIDLDLAVRLYDRLNGLPRAWFAGSRMKLPCIVFQLPSFSPHPTRPRVYHAETSVFGSVEIRTRQDLSQLASLYLVHPWLDALLGREDMRAGPFVQDDVASRSSPDADGDEENTDEEDEEDMEDGGLPVPQLAQPASLPDTSVAVGTDTLDKEARALYLLARLRRPSGALLFTLALSSGRSTRGWWPIL